MIIQRDIFMFFLMIFSLLLYVTKIIKSSYLRGWKPANDWHFCNQSILKIVLVFRKFSVKLLINESTTFSIDNQNKPTAGASNACKLTNSCWPCRICGDTALDKNIHESVSAQIKKNFAKSKWKVSASIESQSILLKKQNEYWQEWEHILYTFAVFLLQ